MARVQNPTKTFLLVVEALNETLVCTFQTLYANGKLSATKKPKQTSDKKKNP